MITIICAVILAGFVAFSATELQEPSPAVAGMMDDLGFMEDYEPLILDSLEVKEALGKYGDESLVSKGNYKVPRIHTLYDNTYSSVCSPHQSIYRMASFAPIGWTSQDYANFATKNMEGYAFGVAWSFNDPNKMVNIGLVENYDGEIKVAFYNSYGCNLVKPPGEQLGIIIGSGNVHIPTLKDKLSMKY